MTISYVKKREGRNEGWEYSEIIPPNSDSTDIFIPPLPEGKNIGINILNPSSNTVSVHVSMSLDVDVKAGNGDFVSAGEDLTEFTTNIIDSFVCGISGIRIKNISGTGFITVNIKI